MPYRLRYASAEYQRMDKRSSAPRNPALAAAMKKLMAGRSIGQLRLQMKACGFDIGQGTLQRAIKGEVGNRLESLDKIARFFDTTVDQILQFNGVDETFWPFSDELQQKVLLLKDEELLKAENILRGFVGIPQKSVDGVTNATQLISGKTALDAYAAGTEEGGGAMEESAVPTPRSTNERQKVRKPTRQTGGGGT